MKKGIKTIVKITIVAILIALSYYAGTASRIPAMVAVVGDDTVYIGCENGQLYRYQPKIHITTPEAFGTSEIDK